ncbi:MAG TPA: tetratricopeptide repeat protein [Longimicrobiales bacterium]|nr:tetratricopeptide repeat protein [Longimicrobiales bacterium]
MTTIMDPRQQIQRGKEALDRREYAAALADFQDVLSRNPRFADARHYTGLCLSFLGYPDAALIEFDQAIELNPRYIEAHINRAITLNELGRFEDARAAFNQAAALEQDTKGPYPAAASARIANGHATLGDMYREAGGVEEAIRQYRRALEIRHFPDIRVRLAQALLQNNQPADAADELTLVLETNPRFAAARLDLGLAYFRMGDRQAAVKEWEKVQEHDPHNAQVRAYFSMLEKQSG